MNYTIYIKSEKGIPINDWCYSAYIGFKEKKSNIIFFEDIETVPVSKNIILVSFIEDTNTYLKKLGIEPPKAINIPIELMEYCGREIRYMTMGEFSRDKKLPIFVKPNGLPKEYADILTPGVLTKEQYRHDFFIDVPDTCPLLVSEVVDFVSEYRCYVIDGQIKGIKHYQGDIRIFPDTDIIDMAIMDYKTQPAGYGIDFGVTSDGRTLLIEVNAGSSLGNYGLEPKIYSLLLAKYWIQLTTKG